MHKSTRSNLIRLFLNTAWAPLAVLVFHRLLMGTQYRDPLDFTVHALGGAAMAYVMFHALDCFRKFIGDLAPFGRYLFSFSLAVVIGVFWEFAELASDIYRGTRIQRGVHETMSDLIADATGAVCALTLILFGSFCAATYRKLSGKVI